jgi:hypothetical protein
MANLDWLTAVVDVYAATFRRAWEAGEIERQTAGVGDMRGNLRGDRASARR